MIKKITTIETFSVRHPVLRAGKPLESCFFEGDDSQNTIHFGFYEIEKLVGVVTLKKETNLNFNFQYQYRIRGMAVLEAYRKNNVGRKLLQHFELFVLENNGNLIWFNARMDAVEFYKKNGYQIFGEAFEISDIGLHFVMFKIFL